MNTTELFKFHFVDRDNERNALKCFMSSTDQVSLWIRGNRGFGKTEFLNYSFRQQDDFELCYFDIKMNKNSVEIISEFIIELQRHYDLNFLSLVKEKYKHFYNNTYKQIKSVTDEFFQQISNIASIILDTAYYAVTFSDENKSPIDIINDYISRIINKKKLCLCIDNFSRCNIEVARILLQIIKQFIKQENFKSCIITTSEDLTNELKEEIFHNLPWTKIEIDKLGKFDYFYQILNPIFMMDEFSDEDINYIYRKCNGSPKKLSTIISKLLEKNGITVSAKGKAVIDKRLLFSILQIDHIRFDESDFSSAQKWIIFSYLCLTEQVSSQYLKDLSLYISKKCFLYQAYNENIFSRELLQLIENKILKYNANSTISTYHDLDYIELMDIFNNYPIKNLFSQYSYEFLLMNENFPERERLLCHHAYIAQITDWHIINFEYGRKLYKQKYFYDAHKIFSCLYGSYNKLDSDKILLLAMTSYETGNYSLAIKQFDLINFEQLQSQREKYNYYFYLGKTYNNIGEISKAVDYMQKALKETVEDSKEYVQTLNVLHMYCFEIPEKSEQANNIFKKIQTTYKNLYPVEWANTMRGCQNFLDNQTSLEILQEADNILTDELEKAYLKTTKGFVLIKSNQLEAGEKQFREAGKVIKRLKPHEYSYAANNLAICYMIRNNFQTAKEILLEALFWNRTHYGELVLNTHLMMCYLYLSDVSESKRYYEFLESYMEKNHVIDPIINRKIYMNIAILHSKLGNHIMKKAYYEKAKPFVLNSSSEWRYYVLTEQIGEVQIPSPTVQYQKITHFEPWFLIYAHD